MGGTTKAVLETYGPLLGLVRGGKMRVLASMSGHIESGLESYPLADKTVKGAVAQGWFSVIANKGTDATVIAQLNADLNEVLARPDVIARLRDMGAYPRPGTPADLARFVADEQRDWEIVIERLGIRPE